MALLAFGVASAIGLAAIGLADRLGLPAVRQAPGLLSGLGALAVIAWLRAVPPPVLAGEQGLARLVEAGITPPVGSPSPGPVCQAGAGR